MTAGSRQVGATPASGAVAIEEATALCRRLRLKYVREQLEDVVLAARAQRWNPARTGRLLSDDAVEARLVAHKAVAAQRCPDLATKWPLPTSCGTPVP